MEYNQLQRVTRVSCAKVKSLYIHNQLDPPKYFNVYFPHVE